VGTRMSPSRGPTSVSVAMASNRRAIRTRRAALEAAPLASERRSSARLGAQRFRKLPSPLRCSMISSKSSRQSSVMARIEHRLSGAKTLQSREPNCVGRGASSTPLRHERRVRRGRGHLHARGRVTAKRTHSRAPSPSPIKAAFSMSTASMTAPGRRPAALARGPPATGSERPCRAGRSERRERTGQAARESDSRLGAPTLALDERRGAPTQTTLKGTLSVPDKRLGTSPERA
jgi:hypothetical protein